MNDRPIDRNNDTDRETEQQRETRSPDIKLSSRGLFMDTWLNDRDGQLEPNTVIDKRIPDGDGGWRSTNVLNEHDVRALVSMSMQTLHSVDERKRERDHDHDYKRDAPEHDQSRANRTQSRAGRRVPYRDRSAR